MMSIWMASKAVEVRPRALSDWMASWPEGSERTPRRYVCEGKRVASAWTMAKPMPGSGVRRVEEGIYDWG